MSPAIERASRPGSPWRSPVALVPLAMSAAALVLLVAHLALVGVTREPDEGAAARVFQLLLVGQIPLVAVFAVRWLPRSPVRTLPVLALQVGLAVGAILLVAWLERS